MCARAALWCALVLAAGAHAYTIDCNHEYTDCDTELRKFTGDEEEPPLPPQTVTQIEKVSEPPAPPSPMIHITTTTPIPTRSPTSTSSTTEPTTEPLISGDEISTTDAYVQKSRARLLNLSVEELKNFAITLHNETENDKKLSDLSDVNLDGDEDFDPSKLEFPKKVKDLPAKFYSNLQAPFHPLATAEHSEEGKDEGDAVCIENGVNYKLGEQVNRSCDETCTCTSSGTFSCSPRCKHPYIRRGRHLSDPLCFESPVDECCSIIACATGHGDTKVAKLEVCKYGNDTYLVGNTWTVGCEQRCFCEKNSVVTCKPRCPPLPQSDKCINVQDPNDACCEVQVCDVSQDVHEDQTDNSTNSTSAEKPTLTEAPEIPSTMRPLVLTEPIGSIKVLQNNSVQVTLMHSNSSEDPIHLLISDDGGVTFKDAELKYDNLILNLDGGKDYILKTKETGTKFNFTITTVDLGKNESMAEELFEVNDKIGCYQDGKFYEVGEEFHIGCSSLCECTGADTRECAALECPAHVGLELVSRGCVRWAPSPPPAPPNCCPRAARCLSDGTCHYKGEPIPNWTDVPISLSGCEQRCFCENGELDCQEVCSPLPPLPPQSLRCPPAHRPAPVNISDDDCCKQWGCVPNAGKGDELHSETEKLYENSPIAVALPPRKNKPSNNNDRPLKVSQTKSKFLPTVTPLKQYISEPEDYESSENLTVFNFGHMHVPYDSDEPSIADSNNNSSSDNRIQTPNDDSYSFFPLKPTALPKQAVYKFTQNPVSDNRHSKPSNLTRNKNVATKQGTKSQDNLPRFHQPVYFMPASKKANPELLQNFVQPKVYDTPAHFKSAKNVSIHNPERFELPIPTSKPILHTETNDRTHGRYMTPLHSLAKPKEVTDKNRWDQNTKLHVLTKSPNPYENVLLRVVPGLSGEPPFIYQHQTAPTKAYSALDLENLLSQMEVESEANRNLERSADRSRSSTAGQPSDMPCSTQKQVPKAPFLPTIPPDGSFQFPHDEDYHDNDIHRPVNSLPSIPGLPPGLTTPPNYGENKKLTMITLMSDSPTSVKMLFGLPPVLVGLRGSVDLRYTDKADEEITHWYSQVFAPADEILTTSRLEFRLTGLKPSTVYKLRGKLYLHNLPVEPESEIYSIRTQDLPTVTPIEVKRRVVDSALKVQEVNDTVAHVTWRRFTEDDLQFIDAIQVRYRPVGNPIYSMTELLHHSRDSVLLHELRPGSRYEASLVLVPPPRATTELHDPAVIEFNTAPFVDPYNWSVQLEARAVGSTAAELTWKGIPTPAERWVRVYRAAHSCQADRKEHDAFRLPSRELPTITLTGLEPDTLLPIGMGDYHAHDTFRLATRDQPPAIALSGLEPDTICRVWLELFLSNGKVKTSNVLEIKTKALDSDEPVDNIIEASSSRAPRGDYYGALVVVGVVAALGALTSLLLLLVVVRRHRPRSVPITPVPTAPRESSLPPYDNPAYKLELQQETMDL